MAGDYSRNTFDPAKHYAGVLMQQGRVQVDADANEQLAIARHRIESETIDVVGMTGAPKKNGGFALAPTSDGTDVMLSPGRFYVEGILCECDAFESFVVTATAGSPDVTAPHLILDGRPIAADQWMHVAVDGNAPEVLKVQSVDPDQRVVTFTSNVTNGGTARMARVTTFLTQPDVIAPQLPSASGTYLAYLEVHEREVSAFDDENLREVALGGPDTARRTKIVWQVRFLELTGGTECADAAAALREQKPKSSGMLTASTTQVPDDENPCLLPPTQGYRGLENQLYRVEIHRGGTFPPAAGEDPPAFKWSRDNGSVEVAIVTAAGAKVTVKTPSPDDVLDFKDQQWTEIIDEQTLLDGTANALTQIERVDPAKLEIEMKSNVPVGSSATGLKLRRWDQRDDATADGVVITSNAHELEAGIEVRFSDGRYRTGDYWLIPARTATQSILWPGVDAAHPEPQLPLGIRRVYAPLAVVTFTAGEPGTFSNVRDCRKRFPALTEICAEDVCFDNTRCRFPSDVDTVQEAIDELCQRTDLRLHNKYLHGWGVVCGLQVYCAGDRSVIVKKGYALDCEGYDIFLRADRELDLATLPGNEHLGGESVCLSIERNGDGEPRFRLHPNPETKDDWRKILGGTLLVDFYEDCLEPVYKKLQDLLDPTEKPGEAGIISDRQRRFSALTSLLIQMQNPKNGELVYLSGPGSGANDHETLLELYEGIRGIVEESKTSCRLTEGLRPPPPYPDALRRERTIYAKGFRKRVRAHPEMPIVYAFGTDHTIDIYEAGELRRHVEFPDKNAIVDDVAVHADGERLFVVAHAPGKPSVFAETHAREGDRWSNELTLDWEVPTIVAPQRANQLRVYGLGLGADGGILEIDITRPAARLITPFKGFSVDGVAMDLQPVRHLVLAEFGNGGMLFASAGLPSAPKGKYTGAVRLPLARGDRGQASYVSFGGEMGEDDIAADVTLAGGDEPFGILFAVLDPSSSSTTKRILDCDPFDGPRQSFDLEENTTIRLDIQGELTAVITWEDSYRMQLVSANGLFGERVPLQVCPMSVAVSQKMRVVYSFNQTSNTITLTPFATLRDEPVDLDLLRQYRRQMLEAFLDLFVALLQSIKDCFCEHLLIDCPTCTETDIVYLGCIELDEGRVDRICDLEKRHYVHTFRSVEYWLSLIPIQRVLRWLIEKFCCLDLKLNVKIPDPTRRDRYQCGTAMGFLEVFRDLPDIFDRTKNRFVSRGKILGETVTVYQPAKKTRLNVKELIGKPVAEVLPQLDKAGVEVKRVETLENVTSLRKTMNAATELDRGEAVVVVERKGRVAFFRTGVTDEDVKSLREDAQSLRTSFGDVGAVRAEIGSVRNDVRTAREETARELRAEIAAATQPLTQRIDLISNVSADVKLVREELDLTRRMIVERDDALRRASELNEEVFKLRQTVANLESANAAASQRLVELTTATQEFGATANRLKELQTQVTKLEQRIVRPPG